MANYISIENVTLFVSLLTAIIASRIAYQQMKISKYTLKNDLFQKRFEIYESTYELLNSLLCNECCEEQIFKEFVKAKNRAKFLFGERVSTRLEEYYEISFLERYYYHQKAFVEEKGMPDSAREILGIEKSNKIRNYSQLNGIIHNFAMDEFKSLHKLFSEEMSVMK